MPGALPLAGPDELDLEDQDAEMLLIREDRMESPDELLLCHPGRDVADVLVLRHLDEALVAAHCRNLHFDPASRTHENKEISLDELPCFAILYSHLKRLFAPCDGANHLVLDSQSMYSHLLGSLRVVFGKRSYYQAMYQKTSSWSRKFPKTDPLM